MQDYKATTTECTELETENSEEGNDRKMR